MTLGCSRVNKKKQQHKASNLQPDVVQFVLLKQIQQFTLQLVPPAGETFSYRHEETPLSWFSTLCRVAGSGFCVVM